MHGILGVQAKNFCYISQLTSSFLVKNLISSQKNAPFSLISHAFKLYQKTFAQKYFAAFFPVVLMHTSQLVIFA